MYKLYCLLYHFKILLFLHYLLKMKPINNIRTNHYFRAGSAKQSSNRSNLNSSSTNKNNVTELLNTPVVQE